jgi:hypothetical protein
MEHRVRNASYLLGLEVLGTDDLKPFQVANTLALFSDRKAQWPRTRDTYNAPILLVKEFLKSGPRPITAMATRDLVYTDAYFGAALGREHRQSGHLVSAVLSSSLASWYFLLTASEFGIWKRRLLMNDVGSLPIPDPREAVRSNPGRELLALEEICRHNEMSPEGWAKLDQAVFNLYQLEEVDRLIAGDGLIKAGWQWREGREQSAAPADLNADLRAYADTFLMGIDAWLQASDKRCMRAELFDLPPRAPLRVIRFVLENVARSSSIEVIRPLGDLGVVLGRIGQRLGVQLSTSLVGQRELRVHGTDEVVIIKPAARRFWMRIAALEDADAVIAESFSRGPV